MPLKKIDVCKVWYAKKENADSLDKENYIVRNVETVSDYIRAVISVLSNQAILREIVDRLN